MIALIPGILMMASAGAPASCPLSMHLSDAIVATDIRKNASTALRGAGTCDPRSTSAARLDSARTLLVQFQRLDPAAVNRTDPDILIIDYSWDGGGARQLSRWDVWKLAWRPGRFPRIVLAYVSVGEAEDYRFYWNRATSGGKAAFLDRPNPSWPGNVRVKFWDPAWKAVLYSGRDAWIDRILDAGFDGVFLDTVDTAEAWAEDGRPDAPDRMADLITALARHARLRDPGFIVVASNPFALMGRADVIDALSGVLAEDYVMRGESIATERTLDALMQPLRRAARAGLSVMLVEYPGSRKGIDRFSSVCASEGFLCYAGRKTLDRIGVMLPRRLQQEAGR